MSNRHLLPGLAAAILAAGCGNSDAVQNFTPSTTNLPAAAVASSALPRVLGTLGTVRLESNLGNVPVELRDVKNGVVGMARTRANGTFLVNATVPDGRLVAQVPGGPTLSVEVRGGQSRWAWLGPVTTMVSRYVQTHPGVTLEQAEARVRAYLQIPAGVNLASGLGNTYRSPFAWKAFVRAAGRTPLDQFLDEQVAAVDSGGTVSFREPDPYPALHQSLASFGGPRPASDLLMAADGEGGGLLTSIGLNIVEGGIGLSAGTRLLGWIGEACGLNFGESQQIQELENQLTTIENQLTEVMTEIGQLSNQIDGLTNEVATTTTLNLVSSARSNLNPVTNRIAANVTSLVGLSPASLASNPGVPLTSPPGGISNFGEQLTNYANGSGGPSLAGDITTLRQSLQGLGGLQNLPILFMTLLQENVGNTIPNGSNLFADLRSNAILLPAQNQLDLYRGYQLLALYLLSEWCHLDPSTYSFVATSNPPNNNQATNMQTALGLLTQLASDVAVEAQQLPPASIASDEVIVDMTQGVMYYNTMQTTVTNGNQQLLSDPLSFSLGPWPEGNWRLPLLYEVQSLQRYAIAAGGGNVVTGLTRMGFNVGSDTTNGIPVLYNDQVSEVINGVTTVVGSDVEFFSMTGGNVSYQGLNFLSGDYYGLWCRSVGPIYTINGAKIASSIPEDSGTLAACAVPTALSMNSNGTSVSATYTVTSAQPVDGNLLAYLPLTTSSALSVSNLVSWISSSTAQFDVSNLPGQPGTITYHAAPPLTATLMTSLISQFNGSAQGPPAPSSLTASTAASNLPGAAQAQPGTLQAIIVTPNNNLYTTTTGNPATARVYCFATGLYSDNTVQDLTSKVTWSVSTSSVSGTGSPSFDSTVTNLLYLPQTLGNASFSVKATFGGLTATSKGQTAFFTGN